jgi:hypothetical protein
MSIYENIKLRVGVTTVAIRNFLLRWRLSLHRVRDTTIQPW